MGRPQRVLEENVATVLVLNLQELLSTLALLLQLAEEAPHTAQSHMIAAEVDQGQAGVGGRRGMSTRRLTTAAILLE